MSLREDFETIRDYHNITGRIALEDLAKLHSNIVNKLTTAAKVAHEGQVAELVRVANQVKPQTLVAKAIYEPQDKSNAFANFLDTLDKQTSERK